MYNKMKLTKIFYDVLVEADKELIGKGSYHRVYPSKHNPNIVYKVGRTDVLEKWVYIFKENPSLFAKIYGDIKKTKFPIKGFDNKVITMIEMGYVTVEKLDTKKFVKIYNEIDLYFVDNTFQYYLNRFDFFQDMFYGVGEKINKDNPELFDKYVELLNLITSIYEIKPSADLHKNQFGYDSNGILKCLDI